jgi:hypothetical protein
LNSAFGSRFFEERAQAAAWKSLPSWAVVATADDAIHPDAERHKDRGEGTPHDREHLGDVARQVGREPDRYSSGAIDSSTAVPPAGSG